MMAHRVVNHWYICILIVFFPIIVCSRTVTPNFLSEEQVFQVKYDEVIVLEELHHSRYYNYDSTYHAEKVKHKKVHAILLAVALGPFGVHRLYLGTEPKVPVIYTLTLGGGLGLLPLIDIIAMAATPDLNGYVDNSKIIMWAK